MSNIGEKIKDLYEKIDTANLEIREIEATQFELKMKLNKEEYLVDDNDNTTENPKKKIENTRAIGKQQLAFLEKKRKLKKEIDNFEKEIENIKGNLNDTEKADVYNFIEKYLNDKLNATKTMIVVKEDDQDGFNPMIEEEKIKKNPEARFESNEMRDFLEKYRNMIELDFQTEMKNILQERLKKLKEEKSKLLKKKNLSDEKRGKLRAELKTKREEKKRELQNKIKNRQSSIPIEEFEKINKELEEHKKLLEKERKIDEHIEKKMDSDNSKPECKSWFQKKYENAKAYWESSKHGGRKKRRKTKRKKRNRKKSTRRRKRRGKRKTKRKKRRSKKRK